MLDEEGLDGLTVRAVLARAGLARRAFYGGFGSKDELLLAVFEASLEEATARLAILAADCEDAVGSLEAIVRALVPGRGGWADAGRNLRSAALSREHLRLAQTHPSQLKAALAPLVGLIERTIADGIASGRFRAADANLQAQFVYNLISTTVHTILLEEESREADLARRARLSDELWEFCCRALVA